ncbi:LLM class flavin-dependent oxidoreductase [Suicoccus acidiformans]|uniref:LLM class flavin-dependent oxidoreductase n=1 Tax=Suicoccus acidiformans TaxID=2036206 RepID=A0A347WJS2_9LACT|nr:LLM class flavin-dependent oxidoreductase [Suicoccus acidiformans]AXY25329.1 LLM class flavin-dependent oxidoreductase [Suicoccus acidiformans]
MYRQNPHILPQIDTSQGIEFGIYTLGEWIANPHTGKRIPASQRIQEMIELGKLAEEAGMDIFLVGESHQEYFVSQSHMVILSAIAAMTERIKLASGATIIGAADPVRVFEDAATLDLISNGRMELLAGRASRFGIFELFGYDLDDYEALFDEKLALLLEINENERVTWEGQFRAPLNDIAIYPRPENESGGLPIWRAFGGSKESAIAAGTIGLPIYQAHVSGDAASWAENIQAYRTAAENAGFNPAELPVTASGFLYTREDGNQAMREAYPHLRDGLKLANDYAFPEQDFQQAKDPHSVLNVGEPQLIIDKILHQHELFDNQRFVAQIDFGGIAFDDVKRTLDILGETIVPAVKKHTRK